MEAFASKNMQISVCVSHPNSKFLSTSAICSIKCYGKSFKTMIAINVPTFGAVWAAKSKHELFSCKNVQGNGEGILHWSPFNKQQSSPPAQQEQGRGKGKRNRARNQQISSIKILPWIKAPPHMKKVVSAAESEGLMVPQDIQRCQQVQ